MVILTSAPVIELIWAIPPEDCWVAKAPMQQARSGLGVAVVNGKIYAVGGYVTDDNRRLGTNEEYDPETDTWTYRAPMPTPREDFAITVYQNKIYCIGGVTGRSPTNASLLLTGANEVYDPASDTWENKTAMPTPTIGQANVLYGEIYIMGSVDKLFLNQAYDPETDSWNTKSPLPTWASGASTVFNDKIYFFGGYYNNSIRNFTSVACMYEPWSDRWNPVSKAPTFFMSGVAGVTTGVMAPKGIYVFEEIYIDEINLPDNPFNTTLVYDPETDNWEVGAFIPERRLSFAVAVLDDTFYVIGGYVIVGKTGLLEGSAPVLENRATNEQYLPIGYGNPDPNYESPAPSLTASPTLMLTQTPIASPSPQTPSPPASPSPAASNQQPVSSPNPQQAPLQTELVYAAVAAAAVAAVLALAILLKKKRK